MIFNITTMRRKIQEKFHKEIINFRFVGDWADETDVIKDSPHMSYPTNLKLQPYSLYGSLLVDKCKKI